MNYTLIKEDIIRQLEIDIESYEAMFRRSIIDKEAYNTLFTELKFAAKLNVLTEKEYNNYENQIIENAKRIRELYA